jgi:hypothetical protein
MCDIVTWNEGYRPYYPPMPIQAEEPREYLEPYMMNCTYKPDTEVSTEQMREILTAYMTEK